MGYGTQYELDVHIGEKTIADVFKEHGDDFNGLHYAIDENGDSVDSVKWYEHEADMLMLSEQYPDLVFELHGEGEDAGDLWVKYFKDDGMQTCYAEIKFEAYDENKLR